MRIVPHQSNFYFYPMLTIFHFLKRAIFPGLFVLPWISVFAGPPIIVKDGKKFGVINDMGKLIVPVVYDHISNYQDGFAIASEFSTKKYLLLDTTGQIVQQLSYPGTATFKQGNSFFYEISRNNRKGLMDAKGNIIVEPDQYTYFNSVPGTNLVKAGNNEYNLILQPNGKPLFAQEKGFNNVYYWHDGPVITAEKIVSGKTEMLVYDTTGKKIEIDFPYDPSKGTKVLIEQLRERKLIRYPATAVNSSSQNLSQQNPIETYLLRTSIEPKFLERPKQISFPFLPGFYCDNGWMLIWNSWGDRRYDIDKNKYVFYRRDGSLAITEVFEEAKPFVNGYAPVKKKNKWGYIDTTGKWVIAPQYDQAWPFSEDRALIGWGKGNEKPRYGFIDLAGKQVIPSMFTGIYAGNYGFRKGQFQGYCMRDQLVEEVHTINTSGEIIQKRIPKPNENQSRQVYLYNLGHAAMNRKPSPNYAEALSYFKESLLYGTAMANVNIGYLYSKGGFGVEKDIRKAIDYYQRNLNNPYAPNNLALVLLDQKDSLQNFPLAFRYLTMAAMNGSVMSMDQLARSYGRGIYTEKDTVTAGYWLSRLFELDQKRADVAKYFITTGKSPWQELAESMSSATKVMNDAFRNMSNAMGTFNWALDSLSQFNNQRQLGIIRSHLDANNLEEAMPLLLDLVDQYDPEALYILGALYEQGKGVPKNIVRAKELYQRSAEKKYGPAIAALDKMK